jgi:hypothetical protein
MSKKLTHEFIAMRTKCDRLESIKNLNLWGNDLEDISVIKNMYNLEVVSLSVNKIRTLRDFSGLRILKELYLRKNLISDLSEIRYLANLGNLRVLWLSENPVADVKDYRSTVIRLLPQITKLDDHVISAEERANINNSNSGQGNDTWDEEEEDLGPQEENVFETENLPSKEIEYINLRQRDASPVNEIYSNNEKNKKIKDKFSQPSTNVINKKYSANIEDNSNLYVQNFENLNINKEKVEKAPPQKRNTPYEQPKYERSNFNEQNKYENKYIENSYENYENKKIGGAHRELQGGAQVGKREGRGGSTTPTQVTPKNENIVNCVIMLLRELNDSELELVKNEIERKMSKY